MDNSEFQLCLTVQRAGHVRIFRRTIKENIKITFGYASEDEEHLSLADGNLAQKHGAFEINPASGEVFLLPGEYGGIEWNDEALPQGAQHKFRLKENDRIRIGKKYLITYSKCAQVFADGRETDRADIEADHAKSLTPSPALPFDSMESNVFLAQLPEIFHSGKADSNNTPSFLSRFLALLETVYLPMTWTVENFDLFIHPESAPPEALDWIGNWYGIPSFGTISPVHKRELLLTMPQLLSEKGTHSGIRRLIRNATGVEVEIKEVAIKEGDASAKTYRIRLTAPVAVNDETKRYIEQLADWFGPLGVRTSVTGDEEQVAPLEGGRTK